ncbi:MAG TPA: hypothetical protein G4N90_01050 [Dehalococcoidia bacterium]|jgi:hypothetical protein|nr:hypothetical protein [Dehalococcoidia bacterium]
MKIGDTVGIKNANSLPDVVGESAEIVGLRTQEFEKYTVYPVWARMTTGERKGKIYGFQYGEVELPPRRYKEVTMEPEVVKRLEEVLKGVTTIEDVAEIERAIGEVKGNILTEPALGFWEGKTPCWDMFHCPDAIKKECPAFRYRTLPCWQIEGTYCKLLDSEPQGMDTDICHVCRAYEKWGHREPIEIKLRGKGSNVKMSQVMKHLALP